MIRRFNRYELKYIVTFNCARRIIADLRGFTKPDAHGGEAGYRVVSLYYDSPGLDFFWAKVDGLKFRRKVRIRVYPRERLDAVRDAMVEIKQRVNRTVQKRRLQLPLEQAERLCTGALDVAIADAVDGQVASEVVYLVRAMHLAPACITDYHRMAFVGGLYDAGLRVTFDFNVGCRAHALKVNQESNNHLLLPPDLCIMEVKVNEAVPDWMTSLLARYNCQLRRVSKYCAGLALARRIQVIPLVVGPVFDEGANHG